MQGGKQIVQSIGETYVPVIIRWFEFNWQAYQDKKVGKMGADKKKRVKKGPKSEDLPWEHDETLARDDDFALFDDFNELALQVRLCCVASVPSICELICWSCFRNSLAFAHSTRQHFPSRQSLLW